MISAILTAAGLSHRMGNVNKLLLPWNDRSLVAHMCDTLLKSRVGEVIVVLGHQAGMVAGSLPSEHDGRLKTVLNSGFEKGLTSSIQAGIGSTSEDSEGYLIVQGDQPGLTVEMIDRLIDLWATGPANAIVAPAFQGKRGNPVLFSTQWRQAILAETNPEGCRNILKNNSEVVLTLPIDYGDELKDIDTPEDYREACRRNTES